MQTFMSGTTLALELAHVNNWENLLRPKLLSGTTLAVDHMLVKNWVGEYKIIYESERDLVLVEVPVMLSLVAFANRTKHWFPQ